MTQQRTVIVTGGSSGIGLEMCRAFSALGDRVNMWDLNPVTPDFPVTTRAVDVSDEAAVEAAVQEVLAATGRIDVICNNAGIGSTTDVLNCTVEEWDRLFSVNARGVFLGTKHVLPTMLAQGSGVIVNTASAAALVGVPNRAAYSATKGAVIAFSRQVAVQYAGTGVRCNWLNPGTVDSPWVGRLLDQADNPGDERASLVARQPMGRLGNPTEIAQAAVYIASPAAAYMTGAGLTLDGGLVAR